MRVAHAISMTCALYFTMPKKALFLSTFGALFDGYLTAPDS